MRRRPALPLKGWFSTTLGGFVLILAVTLCAAWSLQGSIEDLRRQGRQKLGLYTKILESELKRHQYLPLALAKNKDIIDFLEAPAAERRSAPLNRYLEEVSLQTEAAAVYLMDREGLTVATSNYLSDHSYLGHNYGFRPYFQQARRGEPGRYFAIGATTHLPGLFLSHPVRSAGRILGVVAVKVSMEPLEQGWARQDWEEVALADADGVIFTSSAPNWQFRTLAPLPFAVRDRLMKQRKYLDLELPPLGLKPPSWLPDWIPATRDLTSLPRPLRHGEGPGERHGNYLAQSARLPGSRWTIHLFSDLEPVWGSLVNVLAIAIPSVTALLLIFFDLVDYRHYVRERRDYQRRAQQQLEASEEEKRAIINHTRAALILVDPQGRIESFNPTAERFFGYGEQEVRGRSLRRLFEEEIVIPVPSDPTLPDAPPARERRFETLGRRKDGSVLTVKVIVSDTPLQRGVRQLVTIHDITDLRAAEEGLRRALEEQEQRIRERTAELRATQDDLVQAGKLAALGQMSAGIAHELNQPLAAIRTFAASAKLLLERGEHGQAAGNLGRIVELTERMGQITSHLKSFARKSEGRLQQVSVNAALHQALSLVEQRIRLEEVELELRLPEQELAVRGDAVRLEQVLVNLLGNALDAMREAAERRLQVALAREGALVRLAVKDSGTGIAEADLGRLFDPFFTTKEVGEGLGLGLSITYGIVKDWGGAIRARNHGAGAEFVVELPGA